MSFSNNTDENVYFVEIDAIRSSCDEAKVELISNIISQTEIPPDFKNKWCSYEDKIFYEIKDEKKHRREWILFLNNKFYCVYCLCFSSLDTNRFVKGIEFGKNCRISNTAKIHADESHHKVAANIYLAHTQEKTCQTEKRDVLACIVKTIIFIATNGK